MKPVMPEKRAPQRKATALASPAEANVSATLPRDGVDDLRGGEEDEDEERDDDYRDRSELAPQEGDGSLLDGEGDLAHGRRPLIGGEHAAHQVEGHAVSPQGRRRGRTPASRARPRRERRPDSRLRSRGGEWTPICSFAQVGGRIAVGAGPVSPSTAAQRLARGGAAGVPGCRGLGGLGDREERVDHRELAAPLADHPLDVEPGARARSPGHAAAALEDEQDRARTRPRACTRRSGRRRRPAPAPTAPGPSPVPAGAAAGRRSSWCRAASPGDPALPCAARSGTAEAPACLALAVAGRPVGSPGTGSARLRGARLRPRQLVRRLPPAIGRHPVGHGRSRSGVGLLVEGVGSGRRTTPSVPRSPGDELLSPLAERVRDDGGVGVRAAGSRRPRSGRPSGRAAPAARRPRTPSAAAAPRPRSGRPRPPRRRAASMPA